MTESFEHSHRVAPDEMDGQGHVNNVAYVSWMQEAALAHSAALGWPPERYRQLGMGWVVRSHTIEYLRPAVAGDEIVVQTQVTDMKKVTSTRIYRIIRCVDQELLARAETHWAFVNYATGKPTRIPVEFAKVFWSAPTA